MQTVLRSPYSPRVQSHALTSARTFKIPSTSSHSTVWTYENTAQTEGMGSAALAAAVPFPGKATRIPEEGQ